MNTDTTTDRIIAVDYGLSLEAMIAAGKYDWVNGFITAKRFPVEGTGTKRFKAKLFEFGRAVSSEEAVAAMQTENFTPATHVHGFAFGATFPEEQRKYPIACLGSSVRGDGGRAVCLRRGGGERDLGLDDWDGVWNSSWRFLAVQEASGC